MDEFKGYVLSGDSSVLPTLKQLERIVSRFPWFTTARAACSWKSGRPDPLLSLSLTGKPVPRIFLKKYDENAPAGSMGIIESFLQVGEHRIVPTEGTTDRDLSAASTAIGDDALSEEMAEIYLRQGHLGPALDIYNKLCLRIPKKSVYFAQIIADIEERLASNEHKMNAPERQEGEPGEGEEEPLIRLEN